MRPGDRRYTVETLRSGQPRPYADHEHEFVLTIEWIPYSTKIEKAWEPNDLNEELVIKAARALGHDWKDKPDWHEAKLSSKQKLAPGKWKFLVTEAYTD